MLVGLYCFVLSYLLDRTIHQLFIVDLLVLGLSHYHYNDVTMGEMASQITSLTIVYSTVYLNADQRKHQSFASLAFVWGIQRWPVNSSHKGPVTQKMFPFDDVIMFSYCMECNR